MTVDPNEIRERIASSPYHHWAGMRLDVIEPGRVEVILELAGHHLNPMGIVHGGVLAGLLDSCCGLALRTALPDGLDHRTVQLQIMYLRAARTGTVRGVGRAVHSGRRVGYAEAEAVGDDGTLLAKATATFVNLPLDA